MEKLPMQSSDRAEGSVAMVARLWPHCVTEAKNPGGGTRMRIDFDKLRAELTAHDPEAVIADGEERYQFTWPDKRAAAHLANTPTTMTLRPVREASVDFDSTENLYIEGDNLDVLKCLRENYLNTVKMIYIDPPYNTGNEFVYNDDFAESYEGFLDSCKVYDEDGNLTFDPRANGESNGRFHTDWLNMMYPRLRVARDLLADDGVIFISIDDNEVENLKKMCNEVFGEKNFVTSIAWKRKRGRDNSAKWFSKAHEYCLVYGKNKEQVSINLLPLDEETKKAYTNPDNDSRGVYRMLGCWARGTQGGVKYSFKAKNGQFFSERLWLFSQNNLTKLDQEDKLIFRRDNIYRKMFLFENKGKVPESLWDDVSNAANAADEIKSLFGNIVFDTSKPIPYIARMVNVACGENDIILDFFSGSATTAHAVMKLNASETPVGKRKFIMVQLPEKTDEKSEARKAGYNTICEIGEERIRRAGRKVKEEAGLQGQDLDIGFRVLRLDTSNMEDVYYKPEDFDPSKIEGLVDNIKSDRTDEDLLFQVMPQLNAPLSARIEVREIAGKKVYIVGEGYIAATFDRDVNEQTIREIARLRPVYFVMRDASAATDNVLDNFEQLFRHYSPETVCKVI